MQEEYVALGAGLVFGPLLIYLIFRAAKRDAKQKYRLAPEPIAPNVWAEWSSYVDRPLQAGLYPIQSIYLVFDRRVFLGEIDPVLTEVFSQEVLGQRCGDNVCAETRVFCRVDAKQPSSRESLNRKLHDSQQPPKARFGQLCLEDGEADHIDQDRIFFSHFVFGSVIYRTDENPVSGAMAILFSDARLKRKRASDEQQRARERDQLQPAPFSSPKANEYFLLARLESERIIAVLSPCNSRRELLNGFDTVAIGVATGTRNRELVEVCRRVLSSSSEFSEDQLRTLRDDMVRNAGAFLASTA